MLCDPATLIVTEKKKKIMEGKGGIIWSAICKIGLDLLPSINTKYLIISHFSSMKTSLFPSHYCEQVFPLVWTLLGLQMVMTPKVGAFMVNV